MDRLLAGCSRLTEAHLHTLSFTLVLTPLPYPLQQPVHVPIRLTVISTFPIVTLCMPLLSKSEEYDSTRKPDYLSGVATSASIVPMFAASVSLTQQDDCDITW